MKTISFLFASVLFALCVHAQAPQKFSYQTVIRNAGNQLVANQQVGIKISILQGSANGSVVYSETHTPQTNANGLATLEIGGGSLLSGNFPNINWANGPFFVKTETDPNGGNNYSITNTSQLLSVPYALYALSANTSNNGVPAGGTNGQFLTNCNGVATWTTAGQCPGTIASLSCASANNTGTLTALQAAVGVSSSISYTGGGGGTYNAQTVNSTGVTGLTATLTAGSFASGAGSLTYTITGTPASSGTSSFALSIGGQTCTLTRTVNLPVGSITALTCASATNTGTLTSGGAASGVSSSVPYTGGTGGSHSGQTVSSTGVTGLTATLAAGTFASGAGSLTYTITGTPASSGTASFALSIGGQTCTLTRTVDLPVGSITALTCTSATNTGTLTSGVAASGVSSSVPYTGGNGGTYTAQSITSTGVTGLTATLSPGTLATGSGSISYTITGTPASSGTASFALSIGGQTCTLTRTLNPPAGTITALSCSTATNTGTLTQGSAASSISSSVPYTGGNGGTYTAQIITSTGVTGLTATLTAGTLLSGSGSLTYTITGTPATSGTASFALSVGGQTCTLTRTVDLPIGAITALNCSTATNTGTLTQGTAASSVNSSVPYTGGNGGVYTAQTTTSTGVTGLTATLAAGTLLSGAGSLTYTITGTPATSGTASFALNIGGQTCLLNFSVNGSMAEYPIGSVFCASGATAIVNVTNPITGKIWMDRNLGASQAATGSTDANAYGDLYQWGRGSDGHQCRNSTAITTTSSTDQPGHSYFIFSSNYDWRLPENVNLWQGVNGINNPCPSGYHIPTEAEWYSERLSWIIGNTYGAITSPLKLTLAGQRYSNGSLQDVTYFGRYWSSTVYPGVPYVSYELYFQNNAAGISNDPRYFAKSVRCIKN